ncbi:hypothetical protein Nepgr_021313 [Nepenthes gracilis]|uniref:Gnk2-homologous domain-containing protein n=1 Tax=Nepenthes gracilis TaxID=150966 RepID=A0AAD3SZK4_NEPGR|nr:hypothetical protein Nepgr_021313 [Nepenthes gracilis]
MADLRTFLLIVVFSFQLAITSAQPIMLYNFSCLDKLVHSQSHMYQDNLARLLRNLNSTDSRFNNSTMGESPDQVYGLYLCRGDVTEKICRSCVDNATSTIVNNCPSSASALIFYDNCMLRYSNASFFGKLDEWPIVYMYDIYNITGTSVGSFDGVVNDTLNNIAMTAAMGDRLGQKFATMETNYTADNRTLYALEQCTPDLSSGNCYTCLADCIARLPSCCGGKRGGRVLFPSCNIRYEIYPFYANAAAPAPAPAPAPPPPPAAPHRPPPAIGKKKISTAIITGATVATVGFVLLFAMAVVYFIRRKAKNRTDASYFKLVDIASLIAESLNTILALFKLQLIIFPTRIRSAKEDSVWYIREY